MHELWLILQKIYENDMFAREPFVFHVNSSISPDDQYGIRLCTYKSEQVEVKLSWEKFFVEYQLIFYHFKYIFYFHENP